MDAMDGGRTAEVLRSAQANSSITTVDVFAGSPDDLPAVASVLPHTDYFLPSVEEAEALSGLRDHADIARFFLDRGARCCVLTLGDRGAYYHHDDGTRFHLPAFDVDVRCTCGCGDAFNGGFAVALCRGFDPETAIRFAQATSAWPGLRLVLGHPAGRAGGAVSLAVGMAQIFAAIPGRSGTFTMVIFAS